MYTKFLCPALFPTLSGYSTNICWSGEGQLPLHPFVAMPLLYLHNEGSSMCHTVVPHFLPWKISFKVQPGKRSHSIQIRGKLVQGIGCTGARIAKTIKRGRKGNPKVSSSSHTLKLEGGKENVVLPPLRARVCLIEPETEEDLYDGQEVMPLLPGRHQRQRRKREILWLLPFFCPPISHRKTLQKVHWLGSIRKVARTISLPSSIPTEQGRGRNESENKQAMVWSSTKGSCFRNNANFVLSISYFYVPLCQLLCLVNSYPRMNLPLTLHRHPFI